MKKIFGKILILFDIIVLIYALIVVYRMCILYGLEKKGLEYAEKTNFKVEQEFNNDGYITKRYTMCDGNKSLSKDINYNVNNDTNRLIIDYTNNGDNYTLTEAGDLKTYTHDTIENIEYKLDDVNFKLDFQQKLIVAVLGNIHKDKSDFTDAYYINLNYIYDYNYNEIIVDKDTGLILEQSKNQNDSNFDNVKIKDIQKFKYEFDTVKDEEIQKPDLTGWKEINIDK